MRLATMEMQSAEMAVRLSALLKKAITVRSTELSVTQSAAICLSPLELRLATMEIQFLTTDVLRLVKQKQVLTAPQPTVRAVCVWLFVEILLFWGLKAAMTATT